MISLWHQLNYTYIEFLPTTMNVFYWSISVFSFIISLILNFSDVCLLILKTILILLTYFLWCELSRQFVVQYFDNKMLFRNPPNFWSYKWDSRPETYHTRLSAELQFLFVNFVIDIWYRWLFNLFLALLWRKLGLVINLWYVFCSG